MRRVSGVIDPEDFAKQGREIFLALSKASNRPLSQYKSILDFGVGSGRLARMFRGYKGIYTGVDVDYELLNWVENSLPWVDAIPSVPRGSIPLANGSFDCVISISVFTHMNEVDSEFYLQELERVTKRGARLFLTVTGQSSFDRMIKEKNIFDMMCISEESMLEAKRVVEDGGFSFVLQKGHLTTSNYDYGMSFTSRDYIERVWSKYFKVVDVLESAIYRFQDIVVLERKSPLFWPSRALSFLGR